MKNIKWNILNYKCKKILNLKLINFLNLVSSKSKFSGNIISGYWIKLIAIKTVADLEDHLFHRKTEIEKQYSKTV